jgi:hypothetical protein
VGVVVVLPLVSAFGSCMLLSFFANDEQDVSPFTFLERFKCESKNENNER